MSFKKMTLSKIPRILRNSHFGYDCLELPKPVYYLKGTPAALNKTDCLVYKKSILNSTKVSSFQ